MVTTASPVKVATGTATKTMLQLKPAAGFPIKVVEWGCSFDASSAATPGVVELVDTGTIWATVTPSTASDVMQFFDPNAPAQTAGTSGIPLNLGASATGFTSTLEGTIVTSRYGDVQLVSPTNQYVKQFPLGREFGVVPGNFLRIRMTFGTSVNAYCYIIFET